MAATVRASNEGLERVDKARRQKGWAKSESAWADLAYTSVATLKRFWAGLPIQTATFQAICEKVGIDDWESVIDIEQLNKPNAHNTGKRLSFAIVGSLEETKKSKLDAIVAVLKSVSGDATIEIVDVDDGSIKLILGGSSKGLERIKALFESGELADVLDTQLDILGNPLDIKVEDVHFVEKQELVELIVTNGGEVLDLQNVYLQGAILIRANLLGADLSGAILIRANLSGADLSGANLTIVNLLGADLSGANLRRANLLGADLSGANLTIANLLGADLSGANLDKANLSGATLDSANLLGADLSGANLSGANLEGTRFGYNIGLSEAQRANFKKLGAIFVDEPNSDVFAPLRR